MKIDATSRILTDPHSSLLTEGPTHEPKPRLIHDNLTIVLETKHQVHPKSVKHPPRFQAPFLRGAILRARQDPLLGGVDRVDFIVVTFEATQQFTTAEVPLTHRPR